MKIFIIIVAIIVIAFVIKACTFGDKLADDTSRSSDAKIPSDEKVNDKIIIVDNVDNENMVKALTEFCNVYNQDKYMAMPRLWQLTSTSFAVTFPYDVDFASYCFAVNFLKYPINIKWQAQVRAWTTTKEGDDWITDKSVNKEVTLYLSIYDKEYDNVFLTTQDNIGCKLGFAVGQQSQLLSVPEEHYINPSISISYLNGKKHQDFK